MRITFINKYICTFFVDTVSSVIKYATYERYVTEQPLEIDYPLDGSLYVIQETIEAELFILLLRCYNLENDSDTDTELTATSPNLDLSKISKRPNTLTLVVRQFLPSLNGNIICRSKTTEKESTIFIASK